MRRAVPAVAAVAAALAGGAAVGADGPARVVATDRDGDTVAALDAAALRRVRADLPPLLLPPARGRALRRRRRRPFRLVEIASPSEAVLEYYDVRGRAQPQRRLVAPEAGPARALHADGAGRHRGRPPHARGRRASARRCYERGARVDT